MWIQLIEAFGGSMPHSAGQTDLWIALINAVEAFTAGAGGGVPGDTVTGPDSFGASPTAGVSNLYSRADHDHGLPVLNAASSVTGPAGFGTSPVVGTSPAYARQDHSHGNPTFPGTAELAPVSVVMGAIPTGGVLSGLPIVDGVQTTDGMRVLVPHLSGAYGSSPVSNGVWVAHSGAWTRPTDFASGSTFTQAFVVVLGGTFRNNTVWSCASLTTITVDTSVQMWTNVNHPDSGHQYMEDFLEVIDYDNPWTDPVFAWGEAIQNLPLVTYYKGNGVTINTRMGIMEWPVTPTPLVCGWAAAVSSHGNPNAWAKDGCFAPTALVRNIGQGTDLTKLISAAPQNFAQNFGVAGYTGFGPRVLQSTGVWDKMTLDGTFSLCGTGYAINSMQQMKVTDLAVRNFGPACTPTVTAVSVPGSTLQAGGWEIVIAVEGSVSTGGWAGTNWQGWADTGGGLYTAGPDIGQFSAPQQCYTTSGQGISIQLPATIPIPPWGYRIFLRPVFQMASTSLGSTPAVSSFTGTQTLTVNSATPPLGLPASNGTFYITALQTNGNYGLAKMTYTTLSGNIFSGVQFHQNGSTVGSSATLGVGNVMYNSSTATYQLIFQNASPGTPPTGTPQVYSTPYVSPGLTPPNLGFMGTNIYITGGPNAPVNAQAFPEGNEFNFYTDGGGSALILDGGKAPNAGITSFEYCQFNMHMEVPPAMNGIVCINGYWGNHQWWTFGSNWNVDYAAGQWWGAIQGGSGAANIITWQNTQGLTLPGGGSVCAILLGAQLSDGFWWENMEVLGNPSGGGGIGSGGANFCASYLQNATTAPVHFLIDAGASYPPGGSASSFTNMSGSIKIIDNGVIQQSTTLPQGGLGTNGGFLSGGGSLVWFPTGAQNGGFSFDGSVRGDQRPITLANAWAVSNGGPNANATTRSGLAGGIGPVTLFVA